MLAEVKRLGLYNSSLMGFDHPYTIDGVTEVPVQWTTDDAIYFKFLGGGADLAPPSAPGPILDGWLDEWEVLHRYGGLFMLTVHDWISGRAQRIAHAGEAARRGSRRRRASGGRRSPRLPRITRRRRRRGSRSRPLSRRISETTQPGCPADADMDGASRRGELRARPGRRAEHRGRDSRRGGARIWRQRDGRCRGGGTRAERRSSPGCRASAAAAFCCMPTARPARVDALDFNVRAPAALDPERLSARRRQGWRLVRLAGGGGRPQPDRLSVDLRAGHDRRPGASARALRHASAWAEALQPAIEHRRAGHGRRLVRLALHRDRRAPAATLSRRLRRSSCATARAAGGERRSAICRCRARPRC